MTIISHFFFFIYEYVINMLKQTNLDKLFRTVPLITSAKNVQSEDMLNDQVSLSNNEDVNKNSHEEK